MPVKRRLRSGFARARLPEVARYVRREAFGWSALFVIAAALSGVSLAQPLIVGFFIDRALLARDLRLLTLIVILFFAAAVAAAILRVAGLIVQERIAQRTLFRVRDDLFHHLEHLDLSFFRKEKLGDILERLETDIAGVQLLVGQIYVFILSALSVVVAATIAFSLDPLITTVAVLFIPLYLFVERYFAHRVRPIAELVRKTSAQLLSFLEERLSAVLLIQIFGREEAERIRERTAAMRVARSGVRLATVNAIGSAAALLITSIILVGLLWYGGLQVILGSLTVGALVALYSYLGGLFTPFESLVRFWSAVQVPLASIDRVFKIMELQSAVRDRPNAVPLAAPRGEVLFKNVSFAYKTGEEVIHNVTLRIAPGEHLGVVGPTGVGKSTLALLLLRFYAPQKGRIVIDGQDIASVTLRTLRRAVGYLPQEVTLFYASVQENISYGAPGASLRDVRRAAEAVGLDQMIMGWPRQYGTIVGEKGLRLSAGQRQLVGLARLLLRAPKIVILDEATSFLDSFSESRVRSALTEFLRSRTAVLIAHRLRTIAEMDRIILLEKGRIAEEGTFDDLVARGGAFAGYYREWFGRGASGRGKDR